MSLAGRRGVGTPEVSYSPKTLMYTWTISSHLLEGLVLSHDTQLALKLGSYSTPILALEQQGGGELLIPGDVVWIEPIS